MTGLLCFFLFIFCRFFYCSEDVAILHVFQNKCKTEFLKKLEHQKLIEAEKKRIAHMRQQQLESEQFQFFEDQLKKQELARDQKTKESMVMSEQIDGNMLSCISVPDNSPLSTALLEKKERSGTFGCTGHSPPVNQVLKPEATLSAVQSKSIDGFFFFSLICFFASYNSPYIMYAYEFVHCECVCNESGMNMLAYTQQFHIFSPF